MASATAAFGAAPLKGAAKTVIGTPPIGIGLFIASLAAPSAALPAAVLRAGAGARPRGAT